MKPRSLVLLAGLALVPACGRNDAGPASSPRVRRDGAVSVLADASGRVIGEFAPCRDDAIVAEDGIEVVGADVVRWRRTFRLRPGASARAVRLTMDFIARDRCDFALIPGVSWNGNTDDPGNVYHGFSCEGAPWSFASHRTLIPGATYSEGGRSTVALFAEPPLPPEGLSCSLLPGGDVTVHRLIVPEEELPKRVLIREYGLSAGRANVLRLEPGREITVTARLVAAPKGRARSGYRRLVDEAWRLAYRKRPPRIGRDEIERLDLRFAKESLWDEAAGMFHKGLIYDPAGARWVHFGGFSMGWVGRNGELANGLIERYRRSGERESLRIGLKCLDAWAARVVPRPDERGAPADPFAAFREIDEGNACILAEGATAFLEASRRLEAIGERRDAYRRVGLAICEAALAVQGRDGRFGGPLCERGSIGASLIPPLLTAFEITGDARYRAGAEAATRFYMGVLHRDGFLWGGALDTRSIDKESINPLIAGTVRLHRLTRGAEWLALAEDAAYYLAAWQIAQSVPNPPGTLLDEIGYDSFGGTSVATVHMCADNFALATVPWLLRLAEDTGRSIWAERAEALWSYSTQGISRGDLALQGVPVPRPAGGQDETLDYTDWGYDWQAINMDRANPRGAGQVWLPGWSAAYRMTILADPGIRRYTDRW